MNCNSSRSGTNVSWLAKQPAQNRCPELQHHSARRIGIKPDQRGHGIQGVKQKNADWNLLRERIHVALSVSNCWCRSRFILDARVVPNLQRRRHRHQRRDDHHRPATIPLGVNGKQPLRLGRQHQSTRPSSRPRHAASGAIPRTIRFPQRAHCRFREFKNVNGPKFQISSLLGIACRINPREAPPRRRRHRQPLMRDQRRNRDDRATDRPPPRARRAIP